MNRLQAELHRLYLPWSEADNETGAHASHLIDPLGRVRAMMLELTRPPSWEVLSRVWQGVQTALGLPAPAIAVSGTDGLQLWFALAEPVSASHAHAFLELVRSRFLPDVEAGRVGLMPAADASALNPETHARLVPACQEQTGNWSAFVAPDLAPIFGDTPWLDIPPGDDGQAALLSGLEPITHAEFESALRSLSPTTVATGVDGAPADVRPTVAVAGEDPKRFLLRVMNDETVALALRIDAAKALLPYSNDHRSPQRN